MTVVLAVLMLKQQTNDLLKIKTLEITTRLNQYHKEKKKPPFDIYLFTAFCSGLFILFNILPAFDDCP